MFNKKINLFSKLICFLLAFTIILGNFKVSSFASMSSKEITVNGYNFVVLRNNINSVLLEYDNNTDTYTFELNKNTNEIEIISKETDNLTRSLSAENFQLKLDNNFNYTSDNKTGNLELLNKSDGVSYNLDINENPNTRLAFIIPLGIPLLYAALEALLAVGMAIVIGGVVYTLAEEVAQELKKQNTYKYYAAVLKSDGVYVGGGLETYEAKAIATTNSSTNGVMALSFSYARGLCGGSYRGPENHGSGSGWWDHIHMTGYKAHIWFY